MAEKKYKDPDIFEDEYVRKNRTFPRKNAILLTICIILQVILIFFAVSYNPKPQDIIKEYNITVSPCDDGSLDIEYSFVWNALDTEEKLTWVDIGMAHRDFTIYIKSLSDTIRTAERHIEGDYVSTRIYFRRGYSGGETVRFSFTVNQEVVLHGGTDGYYYSFVPCWFNRTPVEKYKFLWEKEGVSFANHTRTEGKYLVWEGRMDAGTYVTMNANYGKNAFSEPKINTYYPFDKGDVYNGLKDDKLSIVAMTVFMVLAIGIAEIYIADSFVSYHRGRGFMTGYGYHIHLYGRSNPRYVKAREHHAALHGGSGRGGGARGCACACACACAGGGRAGCSQKDTYAPKNKK